MTRIAPNPRRPGRLRELQQKLARLSILAVPGDYRLNGPARKIPLLAPNKGDGR
jgi:hypothetical protein